MLAATKNSSSKAMAHSRCSASVSPKNGGSSTLLHSLPKAKSSVVPGFMVQLAVKSSSGSGASTLPLFPSGMQLPLKVPTGFDSSSAQYSPKSSLPLCPATRWTGAMTAPPPLLAFFFATATGAAHSASTRTARTVKRRCLIASSLGGQYAQYLSPIRSVKSGRSELRRVTCPFSCDDLGDMDVAARNHVVEHGPRDGRPMLFAHGFGCDQTMWRYVWPEFAEDHRIVLFDLVGFGNSDLSARIPNRY